MWQSAGKFQFTGNIFSGLWNFMLIMKLSMNAMPLLSILTVYTVLLYLYMVHGSSERILTYSVGS